MSISRWKKLKHWLGLHSWGPLRDDYADWYQLGRERFDCDIAYWKVCEICGKEKVIQTRY